MKKQHDNVFIFQQTRDNVNAISMKEGNV